MTIAGAALPPAGAALPAGRGGVRAILALGQAPGDAGVLDVYRVRVRAGYLLVLGDFRQVQVKIGGAHGDFLYRAGGRVKVTVC